jgi:hypothetical protein
MDDCLLIVQQDGTVLQQCFALPKLRTPDDLPSANQDFSSYRLGKASPRIQSGGRVRCRYLGRRAEGAQGPEQHAMDLEVGVSQGAEGACWGGYRISDLGTMPYGPATRGSPNHVQAARRDLNGIVPPDGGFMPAEGETVRLPAVQAQPALTLPAGAFQQRLIDGHIEVAGAGSIEPEIPGRERREGR